MRNLLYAIMIVIAASAGLLSATPALAEKRVALVVGNAAYKYAAPLSNTLNDAKAISNLLTKAGFDVVEARADLGVVDFKRALRDFVHTAQDADIAVVYYAGHGIEIRGTNYLIPIDAKLASDYDAEDEAVTLDRIILAVEPVKQLRLIVLDACRDNPFMRKMQRAIAQRAVTGGLAPVEPATGNTLVAFAAKAGSTSYDGTGANSPFTTALIKHIAEPGLDIRIALGRVRDEVIKSTGNRQEPFIYGSLGGSTIALVPAPNVADRKSNEQIQVDYEFAERVGNRSAWEAFLGTYQSGYYANLARAQLAKIGQAPAKPVPALPMTMAKRTPGDGRIATQNPASGSDEAKPQQEAKLDFSLRPDKSPEATPPPDKPEVAVDPCKRDAERLAKLRANPVAEEVIALERELGCPRLKPQVTRLRESVIGALPVNKSEPAAAMPETQASASPESQRLAVPPAKPLSGTEAPEAAATDDGCKRERDRLNELRARPDPGEVLRFERDLSCERLRAQVLRLKESLAIK